MKSPLSVNDKISKTSTIKIAEFRKHIRKTKPHKHNKYLELVFFVKGEGQHTIDLENIKIQPNILFVIRKEQVHFWDISSEPSGYVLLLKNSFVENSLDEEMKQLIYKISKYTYLFPKDSTSIQQLFQLMINEYQNSLENNQAILEGLFKALLGKLLQSEDRKKQTKASIYDKFITLLTDQQIKYTKVEEYAVALHTSPQNLNTVCRKHNEKSALEVISEYNISEAKRLLVYSDLNISEISRELHFKDNSHFTKFFKRHTHTTPKEYRVLNG